MTNNSPCRVYHRVIGLLDPLVFSGEGSAAFSVKAERKTGLRTSCLSKRSGGMICNETFASIFTGVDGLSDELDGAG